MRRRLSQAKRILGSLDRNPEQKCIIMFYVSSWNRLCAINKRIYLYELGISRSFSQKKNCLHPCQSLTSFIPLHCFIVSHYLDVFLQSVQVSQRKVQIRRITVQFAYGSLVRKSFNICSNNLLSFEVLYQFRGKKRLPTIFFPQQCSNV